jgi:gamma-glutamylcyclotransferase (GGCT)/AIG2-like uncharacterized protein YtfP
LSLYLLSNTDLAGVFLLAYLYIMTFPSVYQLFVYGSLRSGFRSPAYEYISRFFTFAGDATVKGKLFDMGEYPAAIATDEEAFIIGELYTINQENEFPWAIGQIDDYEGVKAEDDEPQLFRRELADIFIHNKIVTAWIYWYNGDVSGRPVIESGDVIQYISEKNK